MCCRSKCERISYRKNIDNRKGRKYDVQTHGCVHIGRDARRRRAQILELATPPIGGEIHLKVITVDARLASDGVVEGDVVSPVTHPPHVPGVGSFNLQQHSRIGGIGAAVNFRILRSGPTERYVGVVFGHVGIFHPEVECRRSVIAGGTVPAFMGLSDGTRRGRNDIGMMEDEEGWEYSDDDGHGSLLEHAAFGSM